MADYIFKIDNGGRTPTYREAPADTDEAARDMAITLVEPVGVVSVEIFQKVPNGRVSKRIQTTWSP